MRNSKPQNKKTAFVPPLRFPEFEGEWEKHKIGEITLKVGSGVTPKGGETVYSTEGHPFVRSQNVGWGTLLLNDVVYIDDVIHKKQHNTELQLYDILLNITGASIGRCAVVDHRIVNGNVNQHVCIIRLKEKVDPYFVCNFLLSNFGQKQIDSFQCGGNRQGLNFEQIKSITLSLPSSREQDKIAELLRLIDEKIATQSKIIEDLEKLKSAIIEMNFKTLCCGLLNLSDIIEQVTARANGRIDLPILSVNNVLGFKAQSEQFDNREVASEDTSNYKIVNEGIIAYNPARINVGSIALCGSGMFGIVSPMYVCFKTNDKAIPQYVYLFLRSKLFQAEMQKRLEGSVRLCLSYEALCNILIPVPDKNVQQKIVDRIEAIVSKIELESAILRLLYKQRQYLLDNMFI